MGTCFPTYLSDDFQESGVKVELVSIPYEMITEQINALQYVDYIVVCISFEYMYPYAINKIEENSLLDGELITDILSKCTILYNSIKHHASGRVIWFGFEDYCFKYFNICGATPALNYLIDRINISLSDTMQNSDAYIDFKHVIAMVGIANAFDGRGNYRWGAPYSKKLVKCMADEIYKQYLIDSGNTKKCIVLDCDNVLWGGIISEDGIEKIILADFGLGKSYRDFQSFLLTLYNHGVILAVCSKNDMSEVLSVFRTHSGMILKEEHISCFKSNWSNKPNNIIEIANLLNIGLDSIVFIDDSELEINAVKAILPEVTTIQYNRETIYEKLSCLNLHTRCDIQGARMRTETYRTNVERAKLLDSSISFEEYLSLLNTKIDIHEAAPAELSRISELTQRTNKCTNGRRYTTEQLLTIVKQKDYLLYAVSISDRFSDLGIVGTIGIMNDTLDLFSLSCRALGRDVEKHMICFAKSLGIHNVFFEDTGKNSSVYSMLLNN